jgi:glycosyltransferase involved in cell wall biosynthesis
MTLKIDQLRNFPKPLQAHDGWPWENESPAPTTMPDGFAWPRISIVTPSYNQAQFVEETVRSVLLQGYPNLEYIVMDGASTDGSVEILRRYEQFLDYWASAKDGGHAPALISGFQQATGDILGFVNSDDILLPGALWEVGRSFAGRPDAELAVGKSVLIDTETRVTYPVLGLAPTFHSLLFWGSGGFNQPASFWKREAMLEVGIFDVSYFFSFDYDMYLRLTRRKRAHRINRYLAAFRMQPDSKTSTLRNVKLQDDAALQQQHGIGKYPQWMRRLMRAYYHGRYLTQAGLFKLYIQLGLEHPPVLRD